jgi:hypothetical protein
LRRN